MLSLVRSPTSLPCLSAMNDRQHRREAVVRRSCHRITGQVAPSATSLTLSRHEVVDPHEVTMRQLGLAPRVDRSPDAYAPRSLARSKDRSISSQAASTPSNPPTLVSLSGSRSL